MNKRNMSADSGVDIATVTPSMEKKDDELEKMREAWEIAEENKYRAMK